MKSQTEPAPLENLKKFNNGPLHSIITYNDPDLSISDLKQNIAPYQSKANISLKLKAELENEKKSVSDLSKLIAKVDTMSEELRKQRKIISDLEDERIKLLDYKNQANSLKSELNFFKTENGNLKEELKSYKNDIEEIERRRKAEIEKYRKSFDEMDDLLEKEKEAHRIEEEKLVSIITNLEEKLKSCNSIIEEKDRNAKFIFEELSLHKESKQKFVENIENCKRRELELESLYKNAKNAFNEIQIKNKELSQMAQKSNEEVMELQRKLNLEKQNVFL